MDAALARDEQRLIALMVDHVQATTHQLLEVHRLTSNLERSLEVNRLLSLAK